MIAALAAAAVVAAVALLGGVRASAPSSGPVAAGSDVSAAYDDSSLLERLRPVLTVLCGVAGWAFVGGPIGLVVGALAALVGWRVLGNVESPATRRRREQLARDLPAGVDLVGAVLRGGGSLVEALRLVAAALPGPLAEEFDRTRHQLEMGVDPEAVWAALAGHPELGPMGRAMRRTHRTGAPVTQAVALLAVELREQARAEIEQRARSVDVKSAGPLGACFLPAFVVLAVVPLVVGIFSSMDLWRG